MEMRSKVLRYVPLLQHLRAQNAAGFAADAVGGTVTAILTIPQVIAYALLAGLPPQMGLYAGIIGPLAYALVGSSRTVIIGPAAVQSVMVAATLAPLAGAAVSVQVEGALAIGLISGLLLLLLGVLRLGWLTNFISGPVLSGFTTGAVMYIIITQFGGLLGIPVSQGAAPTVAMAMLWNGLGAIKIPTAICGVSAVALLYGTRYAGPRLAKLFGWNPEVGILIGRVSPLAMVALYATLSTWFGFSHDYGIAVVGAIPNNLPSFHPVMPANLDWHMFGTGILLITLVAYIETLSVAKALAFKRRERIDPNREFVALGVTNLFSSAFGGMPVAGSFSKSMVNFEAGARTQLSGIVAASWVAVCAVLFTGMLHELPKAVLAAIIIVAVSRLMDFRSVATTWRYDRGDGAAQVITIISVLLFGVELGLLAGSSVAIALFLYKTSRPRILVMGHVPGTPHFRNVERNDVVTFEHLLLIRVDENLYFANTPKVETELQRLVAEHPRATDVVLILSGIGYIDASSLDMLDNFERELSLTGTRLHLAEFKSQVIDRLRGTQLFERLGSTRIHRSTFDVLQSFDAGVI
jgi:SulP family sulfate permease